MAIDKKLIHFKTWNNFISPNGVNGNWETPNPGTSEEDGTAIYGQIRGTSIVFIKDVSKIWTHGQVYDGGASNTQDLGIKVYPIYSKDALGVESLTPDQQSANKEAFDMLVAGTPAVFMLAGFGITSNAATLINNNLASFVFALTSVFTNEAELTNLTVMISSDGSISTEGTNTIRVSPEIYIGTEMPTDENIVVWYDTGSEEVIANSNSYVIIPGNVENLNKAIEAYQNSVSGYPNVENYPSLYYCDEELGSISPILHMVVNSGMVMLTYSVGSKTFMVCLNAETAEINNLFTTIIDFGDYIDLTGTDQETIASLYEGMLMKGEFVCEHPDGNKYTTLSIEKGPYESGQDLNLPLNLKIRLITADDKLETWEITREGVCTMLSSKSIGDDIIIDTEMLDDSENIVQNKIIKTYIDEKLSALESDLKEYINQAINDAITAVLNTEV